ncbi:MAG: flagellar hook basal-body protein [Cyanobacteria bacterium]|nr:flagellar hook basal-body protein [Cyanobacteriota bacterium]MDA1020763.1 flagellar hook basal-body protein [Cyanobacteriota bacterium]
MSFSTLKLSSSSMSSIQTAIDAIAHNISNVNTTAFKENKPQFTNVVSKLGSAAGHSYSGTAIASINADFSQGNLKQSNLVTDLAINGKGFFTLQSTTGDVVYTRAGHFSFDGENSLVDANGNYVLSTGGSRIVAPIATDTLEITSAGEVRILLEGDTVPQILTQIQLASFVNPQGLEAIGNSQYRETVNSGSPQFSAAEESGTGTAGSQMISGALESSNADLSTNMVDLIAYQRSYQSISRATQTANDIIETTLALGR